MTASCCSARASSTTPVCTALPAPATCTSRTLPAMRVEPLSPSVGRTRGCGYVWTPVNSTTPSRPGGGCLQRSSSSAAPTSWRCTPSSGGLASPGPGSSASFGTRFRAPGSGPPPSTPPERTGGGCCRACSSRRDRGSRSLEPARRVRGSDPNDAPGRCAGNRLPEVQAGRDLDDDDRGHDEVDGHAERRPPARGIHEVSAVLPEVFEAMADEADDQQPRGRGDRGGGHDHEGEGHAALDGDDPHASVSDGEADVDRRYHRQTERVDGRAVQPPEHQRRGGLDDADA